MPVPCAPSLATMRCQYFQPFWPSVTLVAEGEMLGIWPSSRIGPTCWDSPEKAGPIIPTTLSVLIACWARLAAWSGCAWLSYGTSWTLVAGFVALYSSMAIWAPFRGGITMPAFSPVRSPMKPILTVAGPPPPPPPPALLLLFLPPQPESRRVDAAATTARPWRVRRTGTSIGQVVYRRDRPCRDPVCRAT